MPFFPPERHENTVARENVFQQLDQSCAPFTYVCAPAGYGKTVAISAWLSSRKTETAWVTLDDFSDNPTYFCRTLLSAIGTMQTLVVNPDRQMSKIQNTPYPIDALLDALYFLPKADTPYTLVLDDWHRIRHRKLRAALPAILDRMPKNWTVIIISRELPSGEMTDWALKERINVIGTHALKFGREEVKNFFHKAGQPISDKQAEVILQETEGWAIAINARRIGNKTFEKGTDNLFNHYLESQVWDVLNTADQTLLLKTSMAETLRPPFCIHMTGIHDCDNRLRNLYQKNLFLFFEPEGNYRLHHLFRTFLQRKFNHLPHAIQEDLFDMAGRWCFDNHEYFTATQYFVKAKNPAEISRCLQATNSYTLLNDVDWRVHFVKSHILCELEETFILEHLSIAKQCAWAYYLDGNASDYEKYMDRIYLATRHSNNLQVLENTILLASLDYRFSASAYMKRISDIMAATGLKKENAVIFSASLTLNLPYAHRSMRDYSECSNTLEPFLALSRQTIGKVLGNEYKVLEHCVRAGIHYERGNLELAYQAAKKATASNLSSSPEILFCAHMILLKIVAALQDHKEVQRVEMWIEEMLETRNALYLEPNYLSYLCDKYVLVGKKNVAEEWLERHNTSRKGQLAFYQIHQHLSTGRAYLLLGFFEEAILFLKKVVCIGHTYHRPLDFIQANILLSMAFWQNGERKSAFQAMEQSLLMAQKYGFTRVFHDENQTAVQPILHSLLKHIRSLPSSKIQKSFLYMLLEDGAHNKMDPPHAALPIQTAALSPKQMEVLSLMKEGMSYRQIALCMGIKQTTVKTHAKLLFQKLNVNCCEAAVAVAEKLSLFQ